MVGDYTMKKHIIIAPEFAFLPLVPIEYPKQLHSILMIELLSYIHSLDH